MDAVAPNAAWNEAQKVWAELTKGDYSKIDWMKILQFILQYLPMILPLLMHLNAVNEYAVKRGAKSPHEYLLLAAGAYSQFNDMMAAEAPK